MYSKKRKTEGKKERETIQNPQNFKRSYDKEHCFGAMNTHLHFSSIPNNLKTNKPNNHQTSVYPEVMFVSFLTSE